GVSLAPTVTLVINRLLAPLLSSHFPYPTLFRSMLFVGPGDLGLRYQLEGDTNGAKLEAAYERVAAACKAHGVAWGTPAGSPEDIDRKSTRLNSSHVKISYAVFCLKKKNKTDQPR